MRKPIGWPSLMIFRAHCFERAFLYTNTHVNWQYFYSFVLLIIVMRPILGDIDQWPFSAIYVLLAGPDVVD